MAFLSEHDAVMGKCISSLSWSLSWEISVTVVCLVNDCSVFIRFCYTHSQSLFCFTPGLAHPGACHSSSKGKCPTLWAVKQWWVQSLLWSRLVFLLFLSNELVNLNEDERDKLLFSRAWMLLAVTWPGGICGVFDTSLWQQYNWGNWQQHISM